MSEAREAVFASIRSALGRDRGTSPAPAPRNEEPAPGSPADLDDPSRRVTRFTEILESLGADVERVENVDAARAAVARRVGALEAREVAISDSPLVRQLVGGLDAEVFDGSRDRERLLECDLGICSAQLGVAETGTLVFLSTSERHRLVSLVPPVHLAILRASDIVVSLGEALARAEETREGSPPPLVSLVTGPSRTADIELTLVVGVHGPRELQVVVLDDLA